MTYLQTSDLLDSLDSFFVRLSVSISFVSSLFISRLLPHLLPGFSLATSQHGHLALPSQRDSAWSSFSWKLLMGPTWDQLTTCNARRVWRSPKTSPGATKKGSCFAKHNAFGFTLCSRIQTHLLWGGLELCLTPYISECAGTLRQMKEGALRSRRNPLARKWFLGAKQWGFMGNCGSFGCFCILAIVCCCKNQTISSL